MVADVQLARSKKIHRRTGPTFYLATKLLPKRVREATYILYGFFRIADEIVDDPSEQLSPAEQHEELEQLQAAALGASTDAPVVAAFSDLREEYRIPASEVEAFIGAMQADIERSRYETYEELAEYMRGSAAAVGVMMTAIMRPPELELSLPHAKRLGEAFQLTNFLRDVKEDAEELDRVYLPISTLERYGGTERDVRAGNPTAGVRNAIAHELYRAEELYRQGVAGIRYLPTDCQLPILTAAVLYADHHRLIRRSGFDTVTQRPSLRLSRKLQQVVRTRWHWSRAGTPSDVFERASAVPSSLDTHESGPYLSPGVA